MSEKYFNGMIYDAGVKFVLEETIKNIFEVGDEVIDKKTGDKYECILSCHEKNMVHFKCKDKKLLIGSEDIDKTGTLSYFSYRYNIDNVLKRAIKDNEISENANIFLKSLFTNSCEEQNKKYCCNCSHWRGTLEAVDEFEKCYKHNEKGYFEYTRFDQYCSEFELDDNYSPKDLEKGKELFEFNPKEFKAKVE